MSVTVILDPHKNSRIDSMTSAQRLGWVLEFIRMDLQALTLEELTVLGDDLVHAAAPWWVEATWMDGKTRPCTEIPAGDVLALQEEIKACVQSVTGQPINIIDLTKIQAGLKAPQGWVVPEGQARLVRVRFAFGFERIVCVSESTNDRTAIMAGVANLLIEFTDRLATCQACGRPFLRKYRKEYCQVKCSNKVRNKRRLDRKAGRPATASLTTA
jgi:hypothetical protein